MCKRHFQANSLTTGAGGTALACYKQVLKKDPSNVDALAGLDQIEARYVMWTETALNKGRLNKAKQYLESLRKVKPESPKLAALEEIVYPKPVIPIQPEQVASPSSPSFFENIVMILVAVIVILLIWFGWQKNWLEEVIGWTQALILKQKSVQQLFVLNPLDYLRLLWWVLVMPEQLYYYRKKFGQKDERRVGKWLVSTLLWLPLLMPSLALGLEWLPHLSKAWLPETYLWISAGLVGCWLLTGLFGDLDEGWPVVVAGVVCIVTTVITVAVMLDIAVNVAVVVMLGVAVVVTFLMTDGMADYLARIVIYGLADVKNGVAIGVMLGVMFSVAFSITGMILTVFVRAFVGALVVAVVGVILNKSLITLRTCINFKIRFHSWLARFAFPLLIAAHLFLIYYCFFDGWKWFV